MSKQPDDDLQPVCHTTRGYPCVDGPLVGEFRREGETFEFDGASAGLESGRYQRHGAVYIWQRLQSDQ